MEKQKNRGSLVDNLVYSYTGNQLSVLTENVRTSAANDIYAAGGSASGSYSYDDNGNLKTDSRRSLIFNYNVLNLMNEVYNGSTLKSSYCYLSDGTKLSVMDGNGTHGFYYVGSLIYEKSGSSISLSEAQFAAGVIRIGEAGVQEVNYFLKDHLGSVRTIVNRNGVVRESNDYYPFGSRHVRSDYANSGGNRWKYNGKEEQTVGDLGYLDYGARMYDSALGRWTATDPMAGLYYSTSPYGYVLNNPLRLLDPNGAWVIVPTASRLRLQSEPGDDYNSLIVYFGSRENALYFLSENILNQVARGWGESYIFFLNETNVLSKAWADVVKNPEKYGSREEEEDFNTNLDDYKMKMTKARYDELRRIVWDDNYQNYNCHAAAIKGAMRKEFHNENIMLISERDMFLQTQFVNVSRDKAIFGRTVITFGNQHDALFLGKSRDGIITVFTKNGPYFAPQIMTLNRMLNERGFGSIRNPENDLKLGDGKGFFNLK